MKSSSNFARGQKLVRYLLVLALVFGAAGLLLYREGTLGQTACVLLSAAFIVAVIVALVLFGGTGLLAYIVAALVIPAE